MAKQTPAERFATSDGKTYLGQKMHAERKPGACEGLISTFGRTNAETRQSVADSLATATETATVEKLDADHFRITFTVTHRIVPNERVTDV